MFLMFSVFLNADQGAMADERTQEIVHERESAGGK